LQRRLTEERGDPGHFFGRSGLIIPANRYSTRMAYSVAVRRAVYGVEPSSPP
jgi:hypothetical protein